MMRDAVINVIGPRTSSGGGGRLSLLVLVGAMVALLLAGASFLASLQQTVMLNDPNVRVAECCGRGCMRPKGSIPAELFEGVGGGTTEIGANIAA